MQFGDGMRIMMARADMDIVDLAIRTGVDKETLMSYRHGTCNPRREIEERIRKILDWPRKADCVLDKLESCQYVQQ